MITVLPTERAHVFEIAQRMRIEEGVETVGLDKARIVADAVIKADYAFTAFVGNEIACMWGIHTQTILSDIAYMWLVTTPLVEKHQFVFARKSQIYLQGLKQHYRVIEGHVGAQFPRSIRWLKWLGFTVYPEHGNLRPFELRQN